MNKTRTCALVVAIGVTTCLQLGCYTTEWHQIPRGEVERLTEEHRDADGQTVYIDCNDDEVDDPNIRCNTVDATWGRSIVRFESEYGTRHRERAFEFSIDDDTVVGLHGRNVMTVDELSDVDFGKRRLSKGRTTAATAGFAAVTTGMLLLMRQFVYFIFAGGPG